jgi:NAD dependent epimerase/dehydratase family enzyme
LSQLARNAPVFRRILLTGGNGFVGGHLAPALNSALPGAEGLVLRRPGTVGCPERWAVVEAEVFDREAVETIVARFKPDLVVHLAAQTSVGESKSVAETIWRVNFDGSFALASACARAAPSTTYFFVSSSEVYGRNSLSGPVREDALLQRMNVYARSKAAAEQVIADVLPAQARLGTGLGRLKAALARRRAPNPVGEDGRAAAGRGGLPLIAGSTVLSRGDGAPARGAISGEAETSETKQHHGPSRGLGDCGDGQISALLDWISKTGGRFKQ